MNDDREIRKTVMAPLELLPEGEWLLGTIDNVESRQKVYNNKLQFVSDPKTGEDIIDVSGNKIPIYEWNFTIRLKDFALSNGKPRHIWMCLRESLSDRAALPSVFMTLTGKTLLEIPGIKAKTDMLAGMNIKFQVKNTKGKKDPSKTYQKVIDDMIRLV
jgi:hypothetical protein